MKSSVTEKLAGVSQLISTTYQIRGKKSTVLCNPAGRTRRFFVRENASSK
jgi:hypothetical protein